MQSQSDTRSPFVPRQRLKDPGVSEMDAEWDSAGFVQGRPLLLLVSWRNY